MKMLKSINRLRVTEWLGILGAIVLLAASGSPAQAGQNVTLAWDASPDTNAVGYILYYGLLGGSSTNSLDVANQTTATVSNLSPGTVEFFFATAYNAQRMESLPSNFINYTVPGTNTPPTISSIANAAINEDTSSGTISFTVGDAETAAGSLTLSGSSSNPTLVPNANIVFGGSGATRTAVLTPAANQSGTATITVTVSDGLLSTSTSFVLTVNAVNDAPTLSSIANQTISAGGSTTALAFTVGDVDTALSSLTPSGSSSNPTLVPNANIVFGGSGANRTVTVTPAAGQSGTATITVTVSDGLLSTSKSFVLTVVAANTSPTISSIANRSVNEDTSTGTISFTVGDAETAGGSLTLSKSSSNLTLVPNANIVLGGSGTNRTVTLTPATNQSGTATITLTVSDGQLSTSTSFVLTVSAVNDAPTISSIANQTISAGVSTAAIAFTVGDVDTALTNLTLSGSSSNPTLVPNANIVFGGSGASRTVTVTPAAGQTGTATITVTVSDGQLSTGTSFVLTVVAANTAPTISSIANAAINEDTPTGTISFTVGDAETAAGNLTLSKSSSNLTLVPNANIVLGGSGTNRTVTVTPAANQSGMATITVTVSDGQLSTSTSFVLTVNPVNDAPTISSIANQSISAGVSTAAIAFTVGDVDTALSSLTLSGSSSNPTLVPNANIVFGGSGASRTVTVTPAAGQSGTATITVTVSDGQLNASTSFGLTVTAPNTPPTISGLSDQLIVANTTTGPIAFVVSDVETSATNLTVSGTSSNPTLVSGTNIVFGGSGSNRTVTVTPAINQSGTATIAVTVSDGSANASKSFLLTVNPVTGAAFVYLPFEAESATLVAPMVVASDANAGGGEFIQSSTDELGTATITVNIPVSGNYVIWCRVLSPDTAHDSVYVSADNGPEDIYDTAQAGVTNAWQWTVVNGRGGINVPYSTVSPISPRLFAFTAGQHNITFRGREANTAIDQVLVSNDPTYVPDVIFSITAPPMRISSIAYDPAGFVTLTWPSVPGKSYRVAYKTSLSDSTWTPLGQDLTATDTITSRSDYVVGNRFYSVQQLP